MTSDVLHQAAAGMFLELLSKTGHAQFRAEGYSMLPNVLPGDIVQIVTGALSSVRRGDIVLFQRDGRFFLHRVIERSETSLRTKGDALNSEDAPIDDAAYLGRLQSIDRNGAFFEPPSSAGWLAFLFSHSELSLRVYLLIAAFRRKLHMLPGAIRAEAR